jgi:hypothetical protein
MKKILNISAVTALIVTTIAFLFLFNRHIDFDSTTAKIGRQGKLNPGEEVILYFDQAAMNLEDYNDRERLEQIRDWLLLALTDRHTDATEQFSNIIFDKPSKRDGYMQDIGSLEFGLLRSCVIDDKQVIALVPIFTEKGDSVTANEQFDYLAHVADLQRKNLGYIPEQIIPFGYEISEDDQYAIIKALPNVAGKIFFSPDGGYSEMVVKDRADLQKFMDKIEDLTFVKKTVEDVLVLGGRKRNSMPYKGITLKDVAAIWQSMLKNREFKTKIDSFNQVWITTRYYTPEEGKRLKAQMEEDEKLLMAEFSFYGNYTGDSGFSLDPVYDYRAIDAMLEDESRDLLKFDELEDIEISEVDIVLAHERLRSTNKEPEGVKLLPVFEMLKKLEQSENLNANLYAMNLQNMISALRHQKARYDGFLKGTEVGMVLFYTDLLAKLWTIDYARQSPHKYIVDFVNATNTKISPIFEKESRELPSARLWFGFNNDGFQVAENSLAFARNATRIYAASNNPKEPGVEKPTAAQFQIPLSWWNNHYEEIAEYEKEYQRLNEIMKWSLVIGWLEGEENWALSFLEREDINRGRWFPDWARRNRDLKFNLWDSIRFFPKGFRGFQEEIIPLLYSPERSFSGGVSLAGKSTFTSRPLLQSAFNPILKRSNLSYSKTLTGEIETLGGVRYSFNKVTPFKNEIKVSPTAETSMRNFNSQLKNGDITSEISKVSGGSNIKTKYIETDISELKILHPENNTIEIVATPRDVDVAERLTKRMSTRYVPDFELYSNTVECAFKLPNNEYVVKMSGSTQWTIIKQEGIPSSTIEAGWSARVSEANFGKRNYNMKWIEPENVFAKIDDSNFLLKLDDTQARVWSMVKTGDVDLTAMTKFQLDVKGAKISGFVDKAKETILLDAKSLPTAMQKNSESIASLMQTNRNKILKLANSNNEVRYSAPAVLDKTFVQQIEKGQFKELSGEFVRDGEGMIKNIVAYEKVTLEDIRVMMESGELRQATMDLNRLENLIGVSKPIATLKKELSNLNQIARINQKNQTSLVLKVKENREGFVVSDGGRFKKYSITEHETLLADIQYYHPNKRNIYLDLNGSTRSKQDAFMFNMKLKNNTKDISIKLSPENELSFKNFFESDFRIHSAESGITTRSNFIQRADGMFECTTQTVVRTRGVLGTMKYKTIAKVQQIAKEFHAILDNLRTSMTFSSNKLSDLVAIAMRKLKIKYPNLSEKELIIEMSDEFGNTFIVHVYFSALSVAA